MKTETARFFNVWKISFSEQRGKKMILYHGSNVEVKEPRLLKNQRELDFGKVFYTTTDLKQATSWAIRTAARLRQTNAFVSVYELDDKKMQELNILTFSRPDNDWLRFVVANRK